MTTEIKLTDELKEAWKAFNITCTAAKQMYKSMLETITEYEREVARQETELWEETERILGIDTESEEWVVNIRAGTIFKKEDIDSEFLKEILTEGN